MTPPNESHKDQEQLAAMIQELRANRSILDELLEFYGTFLFTGGVVSTEPWSLVAVASYLQDPFAADRISTAATERYRHLAETIMNLGQEIAAGARPRTLRCRYDIARRFGRHSSEIRTLESTLESAMTALAEEPELPPLLSETESAKSDSSPNGCIE
jgi:hypothetical protein